MEEERRTNADVNGDVSTSKYVRKSKPGLVAVCLFVVVCMGVLSGCKKATVKVLLTCETEDAELYVDDKLVGTNDWTGMVSAGHHTAEARKEGLGTLTYIFRADTGEVVEHIFPELPYVSGTLNGHAYVDLGLSVMWATCNVGADTPSDYGDYYAWGETTTREEYSKDNCDTHGLKLEDIGGNVEFDVARANWGDSWRLPTAEEYQELINNCTWTWTIQGGHNGYKVTSKKNGNSIFLPATGSRNGESGNYWTSSPNESYSDVACGLYFDSSGYDVDWLSRNFGLPVRPVSGLNEEASASPATSTSTGEATPTPVSDTINGHAYVDLGLSVKWATCNVGTSTPSGYGDYYAWGETTTKSTYIGHNSKTDGMSSYNRDIGGDPSLDAARANWGGTWRLPTQAELQELIDNCTWTWTTQSGKNGYKVTSKKNGNSIFLPAAGYRNGLSLINAGERGIYWTSSPNENYSNSAVYLNFDSTYHIVDWSYRLSGRSVRPVSE